MRISRTVSEKSTRCTLVLYVLVKNRIWGPGTRTVCKEASDWTSAWSLVHTVPLESAPATATPKSPKAIVLDRRKRGGLENIRPSFGAKCYTTSLPGKCLDVTPVSAARENVHRLPSVRHREYETCGGSAFCSHAGICTVRSTQGNFLLFRLRSPCLLASGTSVFLNRQFRLLPLMRGIGGRVLAPSTD